jgi:hypothetical protein
MTFLLACLDCGNPEKPLVMPFGSSGERGHWAAEHTEETGHEHWWVQDVPEGIRVTLRRAER